MKKACFATAFLCVSVALFSQSTFKKNDLYLEGGGAGLFGSLNYERQLTNKPGPFFRLGFGFYTEKAFYLTVPVGINYLFPLKSHTAFIDAGFNVSWARQNARIFNAGKIPNPDNFVNFVPSIGYRKHTAAGLMWRISFTPVANDKAFTPWVGMAVGKRF